MVVRSSSLTDPIMNKEVEADNCKYEKERSRLEGLYLDLVFSWSSYTKSAKEQVLLQFIWVLSCFLVSLSSAAVKFICCLSVSLLFLMVSLIALTCVYIVFLLSVAGLFCSIFLSSAVPCRCQMFLALVPQFVAAQLLDFCFILCFGLPLVCVPHFFV